MDRRVFLSGLATAALAAPAMVNAQSIRKVLVVGAGSAGLTAAYHLRRAGYSVKVLEAASRWGGRVKRLKGFADFPIDLGAEWIHTDPGVFGRMLGQGSSEMGVETIDYTPQTYQSWHRGRLEDRGILAGSYSEKKFQRTTWYGFFERFVLPELGGGIELNAQVNAVRHSPKGVNVALRDGRQFEADHVMVTVPLSILKRGDIIFEPTLPNKVVSGLKKLNFGHGFKVFLKFRRRFYPDILFDGRVADFASYDWDEKLYYDAAFGKDSRTNILALFTVAQRRLPRAELESEALIRDVLGELDKIYDGVPSQLFQSARVQNWSRTAHILGSYSMDQNARGGAARVLAPIENRISFAGEALGGDSQSTVHGAAFSAIAAVERLIQS